MMKIIKALSVFIILLHTNALSAHPIHVSLTNVVFDPVTQEMSVSLKTYIDDLDLLFIHHEQYSIEFSDRIMDAADSTALLDYLFKTLKISNVNEINDLTVRFDELSIWITFTGPYNAEDKEISITNTWFMDLYHDQANLVIAGPENNE